MPPLTSERRQDLIKVARQMTEKWRVAVRNIRRDGLQEVKQALKDKQITEDELKKMENDIQKATDQCIASLDHKLAEKESDLVSH